MGISEGSEDDPSGSFVIEGSVSRKRGHHYQPNPTNEVIEKSFSVQRTKLILVRY